MQIGNRLGHVVHDVERIGTRRLAERHDYRRRIVKFGVHGIGVGAEFHPRHVFQTHQAAVFRSGHHNVVKIFHRIEQTFGGQRQNLIGAGRAGRGADAADRSLYVLAFDNLHNVRTGQPQRRQLFRFQPDAHAVLRTENLHVADTVHPRQRIFQIGVGIVAQIEVVISVLRRTQRQKRQHVGHLGIHLQPLLLNNFRQLRHHLVQAVLHLHLGNVRIGADVKGDRQLVTAVVVGT